MLLILHPARQYLTESSAAGAPGGSEDQLEL